MKLSHPLWNRITEFGIKQKILLVLIGVLALTTVLDALLASYFTNRQNQESAFTNLTNELEAWQSELQSMTLELRSAALTTVGDTAVLSQLSELLTLEFNLEDPDRSDGIKEMSRTLAYRKTVSLNRLQLALRTAGFSSIAVYTRGKLSYYISGTEAGMMVRHEHGRQAWAKAMADQNGDVPFHNWPAWEEGALPAISPAIGELSQPIVSFAFPTPDETVMEVAIPVQGLIEDVMTDAERNPLVHFFADLSVAGTRPNVRSDMPPLSRTATFAVVVFRKSLGRTALKEIARKTGSVPALFSPDGRHRQQLGETRLISEAMLQQTLTTQQSSRTRVRLVTDGEKSYYLAFLPWQFENETRLILMLASPRDSTLENIRQTVAAILAMALAILLLSIAVGTLWVKRLIDPIVHLTSQVEKIALKDRLQSSTRSGHCRTLQGLQPIHIEAKDEVGALARAFNTMIAELEQSFETLEQRVHDRTAELRQQTSYMRTLFDTLPLWVWLKDTQGRYLAANQACAIASGHSVEEMIGRTNEEIWSNELATDFHTDENEVLTSRTRKIVEREQVFDDRATPVWIETYYAPVLDEDGTLLGTVGVARDISDRKATEAAREAALAEAERLMRLRSDFLAQMSHELRTPLNGILGYTQILLREKNLNERQSTGLHVIQKSGEHLLTLINDVLDLAKIDANKMELSPQDILLEKFLLVINEMIGVKAAQKNLEFVYEASPGLPRIIHADERRLRQVLLNLLDNAIKFTDQGRVTFRISRPASGRLRFEVEDTGRGIAQEQQKTIFMPFEQAGERLLRLRGTGLGLAISQKFMQLMHSEIQVESRLGGGSRFSFEIEVPEYAMDTPIPAVDARMIGYAGPRKTVLVVDDIAENRNILCEMLDPLGFNLIEAENGLQAVEKARTNHPDIILLDVVMPDMDGLEATRRIRQSPEMRDIPIIAISAGASRSDETDCLQAGMNAFLSKPVELETLLSHMGALLHINWLYDAAEPSASADAPFLIPPPEKVETLYQLALMGNMRDILQQVTLLIEMDAAYRPFAEHLGRLAREYQSKAIVSFIEQYRERTLE